MRGLAATAAFVLACSVPSASADQASQLTRVKGDVSYTCPGCRAAGPRVLAGSVDVPAAAHAITAFRAAAQVRLADSSVVEIGDNTDVQIGTLYEHDVPRSFALQRGALRFTIRHPAGAKSNYVFSTPTTQFAVRGTLAYLVSGPNGDQLYCVDCAPGDVEAAAANETYSIVSGQTLNVRRIGGRAFDAAIVPNASVNNPAIDQFLHGYSPFGRRAAEGSDPTGSNSGG